MTPFERRSAIVAAMLAVGMATSGSARAAAWDLREIETPLGDTAVAVGVPSTRFSDVRLVIGCDGDTGARWRGVAVIEAPGSRAGLGMSGDVRVRFGEVAARDRWSVKVSPTEHRIFEAPESTRFARRLLREEAASATPRVTIEIHGVHGKPVPLTFPLTGLGAKIGALAARCADWNLKE
ncbi:MAG: hypothetical protein IT294_12335 [Deltaproteobacteria bacterium]|nr:hypothetical protein [Deltaproteobacteria bacterium]